MVGKVHRVDLGDAEDGEQEEPVLDEGVVDVFGVDGGRSDGHAVELRNARRELRERRWERVDLRDAKTVQRTPWTRETT